MYVRIKICVAVCDTNRSLPDSMQTINHCFNPEASWLCSQVSQQSSPYTESMCQARWSGYQSVWG